MATDLHLLAERVNLRVQLLSVVIAIIGIVLMSVSPRVADAGYHKIATLLEESGAAIFIAGVLAVIWELAGKRAFADEILAKANMSRDLAEAGIDLVAPSFKDERVNWEQLFKSACRLDIFVSYAHTWRNTQSERINRLLADPNSKLRVILPDSQSDEVLTSLSQRFNTTPENVKQEIDEAIKFFERRREKAKGVVEIHVTRIMPLFSFYCFNSKVVFALYNHREDQEPVPSFLCDREGFLFGFFSNEFEAIVGNEKRTRRVEAQQVGPEHT